MADERIVRISRDQYYLWRNSPATQTVFAFLRSYQALVRREHIERWEQGNLDPQLESRALGVSLFTDTFIDLDYDAIAVFLDSLPDNE